MPRLQPRSSTCARALPSAVVMPVTEDEARHLVTLAVACRPHGAPTWDAPGILAALSKVRHLALADVAMATIRAASDRAAKTPGVISQTASSYWREKVAEQRFIAEPYDISKVCGICEKRKHLCEQIPEAVSGHVFESKVDTVRGRRS